MPFVTLNTSARTTMGTKLTADSGGQHTCARRPQGADAAEIVGNVRQVELEEGDDQEREPEQREGVHRDLGPICASARRQCCGPQSD